jgi:hypothetical protein
LSCEKPKNATFTTIRPIAKLCDQERANEGQEQADGGDWFHASCDA